ncbi:MAG TPA: glycosyltransferase family 4 protein [bacterium]|nr:glycosyltransferase family 4 protein [bacterium]
MRVLLLTEYYAPHAGGTAVYYHAITRRLRPDVIMVAARTHPLAAEFDGQLPFPVVRTPFPRIPKVRLLVEWWAMVCVAVWGVWRRGVTVLQAGQVFPLGLAAYVAHRITGVPYAVYVHGEELTVAARLRRRLVRYTLGRAEAVFVNSLFTARQALSLGVPRRRLHLVRPAVDTRRFRPRRPLPSRARWGDAGRRVLLTVGRLVPRKGQDTVIRLLPRLAEVVPDVVYWVAGDGSEAERRRLAKLAAESGVAERVRFLGTVPLGELASLYSACDVFVMLNRTMPDGDVEGFGTVFLEAGACGKPVVGGRSGGAPEAVRDGVTGFLVRDGDDEAAVEVISRLLRDEALRGSLGEAGRRHAVERCSWDRAARRVAAVSLDLSPRGGGAAVPAGRKRKVTA